MKKYDVVHLVRIFKPNTGGMELVVDKIIEEQRRRGYSVAVVTSSYIRNPQSNASTNFILNDKDIFRLRHVRLRGIILPIETIKLNCSILHIHGMDPFVDLVSLSITSSKKILSPHGGFFHTNSFLSFKKFYFKWISHFLYSGSIAYSISQNDQKLMNQLGVNKNYLMGCGFKERKIQSSRNPSKAIIFGRISKNKNVELSVKIGQEIGFKEIHIVGPSEYALNIENKNSLFYHGALEEIDLNQKIIDSGFFICMSSYEGLGMSLIEALDSGLRCIISDIPAFRYIYKLLDNNLLKKFVFFYQPESGVDINWVQLKITKSEQEKMSLLVRDKFSWSKVVDKIMSNE